MNRAKKFYRHPLNKRSWGRKKYSSRTNYYRFGVIAFQRKRIKRIAISVFTLIFCLTATYFYSLHTGTQAATIFLSQDYYRWYQNADSVQPGGHMQAENQPLTIYENTPFTGTVENLRLRMGLSAGGTAVSSISDMNLQYAKTASWYDSDWGARRQIVFNNSASAEDLTDFPVLVKLNSSRIDYAKTQNSGQDIRFTDSDGTTQLDYEIEEWNESGTSYVWVEVPQIDAGSSTDFIYMYYGNSGASDGQNVEGVWSNGFVGVWHLAEDPSISTDGHCGGGTAEICDSTSNNYDGEMSGSMTNTDLINANINGGHEFDGTNDVHAIGDISEVRSAENVTLSAWMKRDSANSVMQVGKSVGDGSGEESITIEAWTDGEIYFLLSQNTLAHGGFSNNDTNWHHVTLAYDGTQTGNSARLKGFMDGSEQTLSYSGTVPSQTTSDTNSFDIGESTATHSEGQHDEIRLSNVTRSADWVEAEYLTMTDAMNTFMSEESENLPAGLYWQNVGPMSETEFGTGGIVDGASATTVAYDVAKDSEYAYIVGTNSSVDWRIEKRSLSDGSLDTDFGTSGVVTGTSGFGTPYSIAIDSNHMYVVGTEGFTDWRIEKRELSDGDLDTNFGTSGVVTGAIASTTAYSIAVDSTYMYVVGNEGGSDWRIEKRELSDGDLDTNFGTSGVVTGVSATDIAWSLAIDSTYMYVVGSEGSSDWRIEKRELSDGDLDTNFGTSGVVTGASASNSAHSVSLDSTYMYITGIDDNTDWRIEKRELSDGDLDTNFGTSGVVTGASASHTPHSLTIDSTHMYVAGTDSNTDWRIEKRELSDGDLDTNFGTSGVVTGASATQTAYSVTSDEYYMYIVGNNSSGDWRVEKRSLSDGDLIDGNGSLPNDEWNYTDNVTPSDGATISSNLLSSATILQKYFESNPLSGLANTITATNTGEWDFSLSADGLEVGAKYYFRLYPVDGDTEITYNEFPSVTFDEPSPEVQLRGGTIFNDGIEQPKTF